MLQIQEQLISTDKYELKCPYILEDVKYIIIHNTANNATASAEIAYMQNNSTPTSFHFAVDDVTIIQGIPLDRNAFANGDGNGGGNRNGISIEICYSKSGGERFLKAEDNAVDLVVHLLKKYNLDINAVKKHQDFSGKYCPHRTLTLGWDRFIDKIKNKLYLNDLPEWAKEGQEFVVENNISDGTRPQDNVTRAEMWVMLKRFLDII